MCIDVLPAHMSVYHVRARRGLKVWDSLKPESQVV